MEFTKKLHNLQSLNFLHSCSLRVAVLGGSFNPPHSGHIAISNYIQKKYHIDLVIWLVALQNPLKSEYSYDFSSRCHMANEMTRLQSRILVSSAEEDIGSIYSYDTMAFLVKRFTNIEFTWLMGIDNLQNFHKWKSASRLVELCHIIIYDRNIYGRFANHSRFLSRYKGFLASFRVNPIIIERGTLNPNSSSLIRNSLSL